jgi:two-component system response regulator
MTMVNKEIEILLVEDNPDDAELTERALRKGNILNKFTHLRDGAEALDFLFERGEHSDSKAATRHFVILLDLKMPKVSGIEVLQEIRSKPATRFIPVIVLTSSAEDPDIQACYQLGVNSYIVKPVGSDNFFNCVTQLGLYWVLINTYPDR